MTYSFDHLVSFLEDCLVFLAAELDLLLESAQNAHLVMHTMVTHR